MTNGGTFVGNRVKEICSHSQPVDWRHIPGISDPTDLPSRGCSPSQMLESKWWDGPAWLKQPESKWPSWQIEHLIADETIISSAMKKTSEMKKTVITRTMIAHEDKHNPWYVQYFSSYLKIVKNDCVDQKIHI